MSHLKASSFPPDDPPAYESNEAHESEGLTPAAHDPNSPHGIPNRNVPYRPSSELQSQIDRLGSSSSMVSPANTRTEYFDILPSFQLFQSILKRNDFEFDENHIGSPPNYSNTDGENLQSIAEIQEQSIDSLNAGTSNLNELNTTPVNESDSSLEGMYLFSDNENEEGLQQRSRLNRIQDLASRLTSPALGSRNSPLTHESYGHSVLDNIDRLPRAKRSPLEIQIYVTKDVPAPHRINELETKLKEYSCGDFVNGYIIITNNLNKPVDFGMFMVSLEGSFKAIKYDPIKQKQRIVLKKFLKMYDLSASYNYGVIPSSAGIEYAPYSTDTIDNCIMGLPDDRVLRPHGRYKKFITFRFPEMLLDNSCPHNVLRHTMPPPSFGVDESSFHNRSANIEVNKALGYGCLRDRGTPLKVRDNGFEGISVSYSIEAKFIDKQHTLSQDTPIQTHDINYPEPGSESRYVVSQSSQYFLRFIPNVESQVKTYSLAYEGLREDTFDNLGIDGMFLRYLKKHSTWTYIEQMNHKVHQEIRDIYDRQETSLTELKKANLFQTAGGCRGFSSSTEKAPIPEVSINHSITSKQPVTIFGKKRRKLFLSNVEIGRLTLIAEIPKKLLLYDSPRLLKKYNNGVLDSERLSGLLKHIFELSLAPVLSNMEDLYNRNQENILKDISFDIIFESFQQNVQPPAISHVDFSLVAWTYNTEYPIPVSFEHDFFYSTSSDKDLISIDEDTHRTLEKLVNLQAEINQLIDFLKESKTVVSRETYSYLKSLSMLGLKRDILRDYFKRISHHNETDVFENTDWKGHQTQDGKMRWVKHLNVPLEVINKNNYTLIPSFQNCLVGRLYGLQIDVKLKNGEDSQNHVKLELPILVG